ncbi:MAG: ABC transporter permease [Labilithrix sp.]|nr:ABC transporter permease [Labilithrix sp.]MCW5833854.1 ABC transporter permease [Labilithrix sp.]
MRLFLIAARNLKRSWFRTTFTVAGSAVALVAFIMLRTVLWAWSAAAEYAAQDRIGTRHKVTFIMPLPLRYADDVRAVPGVKQATYMNWFGAKIPTQPDEFFASMAVESKTFFDVYDEMVVSPEDKARWLADKKGAIVGHVLAKKMGWKVGDKVVLEGTIYPGDWEFIIDGVYKASRRSIDDSEFLFHWDYLNDTLTGEEKDTIGWVTSRVTDSSRSADISKEIDRVFDERDTQTVTMSERAMNVSFMAGFSALLTALDVVSIVILGIMLLVLGNTIAMGVRERTKEYAVLRAIGFEPWHVRFFVVAEAATLGIVSGVVGVGVAYPFVNNVLGRAIEENMGAMFPYFRVEPSIAVLAIGIAIALAALASLIPSIQAGRVSVTDALRRVG